MQLALDGQSQAALTYHGLSFFSCEVGFTL